MDKFKELICHLKLTILPILNLYDEYIFLYKFKHRPYIIRCFGANVSCEDNVVLYNLMPEYTSRGSLADRLLTFNSLPEIEVKKHTNCQDSWFWAVHDFGIGHERKQKRMIRGTKRYMAPELVRKAEYGPQVDIWALGCTVYERITGKLSGLQMLIMCCTKSYLRDQSFGIQSCRKKPKIFWGDVLWRRSAPLDCGHAVEPCFSIQFIQTSQHFTLIWTCKKIV